jgi:hypothetical protein
VLGSYDKLRYWRHTDISTESQTFSQEVWNDSATSPTQIAADRTKIDQIRESAAAHRRAYERQVCLPKAAKLIPDYAHDPYEPMGLPPDEI